MSRKITATISFNDESIILTENDILELIWSNNMMNSDLSMSPGICEQSASIRFYDRNQIIFTRFSGGESTNCSLLIQVESNGTIEETCTYMGSEFVLENDNYVVQLSLTDNTQLLDNVVVPQAKVKNRTVDELLNEFFNYLPTGNSWQYFDADTHSRCTSIIVPNSWYREGTLKDFLNKICVLGLLRIFCNSEKFYVARCI